MAFFSVRPSPPMIYKGELSPF